MPGIFSGLRAGKTAPRAQRTPIPQNLPVLGLQQPQSLEQSVKGSGRDGDGRELPWAWVALAIPWERSWAEEESAEVRPRAQSTGQGVVPATSKSAPPFTFLSELRIVYRLSSCLRQG